MTTANRTGVALPRVEYFDDAGMLRVSDGDGVGRLIAMIEPEGQASDAEMFEIARRCNAHDSLVAALRDLVDRFADHEDDVADDGDVRFDTYQSDRLAALIAAGRAALAQAEKAK